MTFITSNSRSFFLNSPAKIVDFDRDMASDWASAHIVSNPALKWIVGKYVEADNANSNGQYWTLSDLRLKSPTIQHSPMNISHRPFDIVGTFVASELIYPSTADQNPYIETVGAFWKYYFPDEFAIIQDAYKQGELFLSMECISETVTCVGEAGCGQSFAYAGPMSDHYCDHIKSRASYRQLDNPHFLAGALIAPPDRPGWKNASVQELSVLNRKQEEAHSVIDGLADQSHLSNQQKEAIASRILSSMESLESTTEQKPVERFFAIIEMAEETAANSYPIPDRVKKNAQRGLELRKKFGRGGTSVGENTARTLAAGGSIGIEKIRHINRYFPRHAGDNLSDKTSNGWIAWLLWGGDAAWSWTRGIIRSYEAQQKKENAGDFTPESDPTDPTEMMDQMDPQEMMDPEKWMELMDLLIQMAINQDA